MASHTQFPHPIAFVTLTPDEIAALNPVPWMTVADTQGNLTVWREGIWANVPLFTGTRHDGDILTWKTSQDIWVPSSNVNILGTLTGQRAYFTQDHTSALEVRRTWSTLVATKTGTGDMTPWGDHVLTANTSFKVVIDTAGSEQTATFKWSQDGGATYVQTLQPVTDLSRIALVSGVFIQFLEGSYDLADQWTWTAIGTANQLYDLQVDTTNSIVKVGVNLQVADPNFGLSFLTATVPRINFDANDSIQYDRPTNSMKFFPGATQTLTLTAGLVSVNTKIQVADSAFTLYIAASDPIVTFDTLDYFTYRRASNQFEFDIGGSALMTIDATGGIGGSLATITTLTSTTATITTMAGNVNFTGTPTFVSSTHSGNMSALQALVTNIRFTSGLDPGNTERITLAATTPHITLTGDVKTTGFIDVTNEAVPASPAASITRMFSFAKATGAYQDTPRWMDSSGHDSGPTMRALTAILYPAAPSTATAVALAPTTILGMTGLGVLFCPMTVHSISYTIIAGAVGATGTVRVAIYTESGALVTGTNVTDNPAAGVTGVRTVTLGGDVYLPAGNYRSFVCIGTAYGTTPPTIGGYTTSTTFQATSTVLSGTVVCTAGAAPSPVGTITSVNNSMPYFMLIGSAT